MCVTEIRLLVLQCVLGGLSQQLGRSSGMWQVTPREQEGKLGCANQGAPCKLQGSWYLYLYLF